MVGEMNIWEILWSSGPVVKLVLLILVASSVLSWALILKKKKELQRLAENNLLFENIYKRTPKLREILDESSELPFSPFAVMFRYGYEELLKVSSKFANGETKDELERHFSRFGLGVIRRALTKGVNESNEKLESLLGTLASIGSVAPYIGLFGTVWGIINSFTGLAGGGASLDKVAPGIAEALVATAVGLFAAIPAVLYYNHFNAKVAEWHSRMDTFEQDFLNMVERSIIGSRD